MTCGICGRSGFHGDEGLRKHRKFNKTYSDIMDQIRAARKSAIAPNTKNGTLGRKVGSTARQDGLASMMEEPEDDDNKEDSARHHLWIIMQLAMTTFYMYFIYAYKM